jgi:predicted outer membrane protein
MPMRKAFHFLLPLGLGTAVLSGCGRAPAPPAQPSPVRPSQVQVVPLSPSDYVATASSIDLLVIQASQLAQTKARGDSVRELAARLLTDHRGVSAQLSLAGRRLNLLPSATMMPRHQAMLEELKGSWDFDAAYKRTMIAVHEQGVRVHGDFAKAGNSPTLRPVAEIAFPAMRHHLDELRGL